MQTHIASVRSRRIAWDMREVVQHGLNADVIKLDLDAEWRECDAISVVLCDSSLREPKRFAVGADRTLALPPSMLAETGPFSTCVIGYTGGVQRIVTAQERYPLVVVGSGCTGPLDPGDEQPDLWGQLMAAEAARIEAELAREAAEKARTDAEAKRIAAEKSRETASAEAVKAASEAAAKAEEAARQAEARVTAALAEVAKAEQSRTEAEKARAAAESKRAEAEAARIAAESKREAAEAKRKADSAKAVADANAATSAANMAAGKADAAAQAATEGEASRVAAETARVKAEQARVTAETGRVEAESQRVAADAERGQRVDASVQKADAATAKATEAAGRADASATEADAAAKRADEAAKGASENILVGTETAAVVHVEDAWPTLLRECKVLGKSVQDGTPTPDAPKPITSVGKAEVVTAGKNLLDPTPRDALPYTTNGITYSDAGNGMIHVKGTATDTAFLNLKRGPTLKGGCTYILSVTDKSINFGIEGFSDPGVPTRIDTDTSYDGAYFYIQPGYMVDAIVGVQLEVGSAATPYAPHVPSVSTSIDLQGHELRSLPNGVRDDVVVGIDGTVRLIKRVGSAVIDGSTLLNIGTHANGQAYALVALTDCKRNDHADDLACSHYVASVWTDDDGKVYIPSEQSTVITDGRFIDKDTTARLLDEMRPRVDYPLAEPQTIPLGKVTVPALPESTSNVWNADPIGNEVSATYVRDVNIVIGKLEQTASALAAATL